MAARRFFIENTHGAGERVVVANADAHKIRDVLRLRAGDTIEIVDSSGQIFDALLADVDGGVTVELRALIDARDAEPSLQIDVAQGIPKGQKMDFVVEKLSELGVASILPLASERAVVRDPGDGKVERWRRLAKTAAQQSGRRSILTVNEPIGFEDLLGRFGGYDVVLFPWEVASGDHNLRAELPAIVERARRVLVVVGPEGGFSHAEAGRARDAGARVISLGRRILRTETAALVLVAILQYLSE
ncbi:MAG: 16S rRNA (uracil(1498)-N(3))-methyltransferase [Candidatus Eremiobacteraeota bacterium]|nr:16S rRNA (uracil(1498)-N(3))-methyltransferase [Candidatus Eremiobacteraeota bacterium]